ncbi:hypothetical protein B0T18DRAFT_425015 [Schizothecium vesticola]|uniref:Uncharacterized protein n=1 Tax=Schizothecium vesticola TaxID=314040 RepID=A0AA40KD03_9PEZI|nr:hypothetical protein B0T18DRAFT_425015 [Schizothecium vesticola]
MNRHLYGPRRGPPLRTLAGSYPDKHVSTRWTAKIRRSSLYVHSTVVFRPEGFFFIKSLREALRQGSDFLVCRHHPPESIPELRWHKEDESSRPVHPTAGTLRSCAVCWTDYRVRVAWTGGWVPLRRERCRIKGNLATAPTNHFHRSRLSLARQHLHTYR